VELALRELAKKTGQNKEKGGVKGLDLRRRE